MTPYWFLCVCVRECWWCCCCCCCYFFLRSLTVPLLLMAYAHVHTLSARARLYIIASSVYITNSPAKAVPNDGNNPYVFAMRTQIQIDIYSSYAIFVFSHCETVGAREKEVEEEEEAVAMCAYRIPLLSRTRTVCVSHLRVFSVACRGRNLSCCRTN